MKSFENEVLHMENVARVTFPSDLNLEEQLMAEVLCGVLRKIEQNE